MTHPARDILRQADALIRKAEAAERIDHLIRVEGRELYVSTVFVPDDVGKVLAARAAELAEDYRTQAAALEASIEVHS